MNDLHNTDEDPPLAEQPRKPAKPVGVKFILAAVLLFAYVAYLFYVGFSDPR